jgi:hypothetical protein
LTLKFGPRCGERCLCFLGRVGVLDTLFFGHRKKDARLFDSFPEFLITGEPTSDTVLFLKSALGRFGIIPEVRLGRLLLKFVQSGA